MKNLKISLLCGIFAALWMGCTGDYDEGIALSGKNPNFYSDLDFSGTEEFGHYGVNGFIKTSEDSLSTFGFDVDNGSYTWARGEINRGTLPAANSVRPEEFINFFEQNYKTPAQETFEMITDLAPSPFRNNKYVLRVGLNSAQLPDEKERKPWNITFLVDVSGSMSGRLSLVKESLVLLVNQMQSSDKISIATYAGTVKTVLEPSTLDEKDRILNSLNNLNSGGGTSMADGLVNGYETNLKGFMVNGVNRVIVCSDGDANIGKTGYSNMLKMIESYVDEGVYMTTLGFGTGNYKDETMEQIANKGNGNYYYVDDIKEAGRIFGKNLIATMQLVALDVKVQIEFHSQTVKEYRLVGYENRDIKDEDFNQDTTDAGDMGPGHHATAIYELILNEQPGQEILNYSIHYKDPESMENKEQIKVITVQDIYQNFNDAPDRYQWSVAVAEYADILRNSPYVDEPDLERVQDILEKNRIIGSEEDTELLELVSTVENLKNQMNANLE